MNVEHSTSNIEPQTDPSPRPSPLSTGAREEEIKSPWFREPSGRERLIATGLFCGFGLFFSALAWVQRGWWFSWVILGLAAVSLCYAGHHVWRHWHGND